MLLGKRAAVVLAAAALSWGTSVWAQQQPPPAPPHKMPTPPAAVTAEPKRPLTQLLDDAGMGKTLDDLHLKLGGHFEGSWTWNFHDPDSNVNPGRVFDFEHNKFLMNQLSFFVERTVDPASKNFDVGGRVEAIYGTDAGLIHANGLSDYYDGPRD